MELSHRIKEYRSLYDWTQEDLAKTSGLSLSIIKKYEAGIADNITYDNLKKISNAFNITPSVFIDEKLSVSDENLSVSPSNLKKSLNSNDSVVKIPYFQDTYASAEFGAINYDETPIIMEISVNFIKVFLQITTPIKNMHIINAKGDSMEPTIQDGELLYINPISNENGINSGSIYIINFDGDILVKRIDKNPITKALTLISDNPKYKPIEITKENLEFCHIVGRVVAHTAKL